MKKAIIFLFGLIIITGSIFPPSLKVYTTPMDIVVETAIASMKSFKKVPVYVPGSINPNGDRLRRSCYYRIPSPIDDFAGQEGYDFLQELSKKANGEEISEMLLVSFIKRFNISKETIKKAVEEQKTYYLSIGIDITDEEYELPNVDIIYTFNNKLIDYYYRRA